MGEILPSTLNDIDSEIGLFSNQARFQSDTTTGESEERLSLEDVFCILDAGDLETTMNPLSVASVSHFHDPLSEENLPTETDPGKNKPAHCLHLDHSDTVNLQTVQEGPQEGFPPEISTEEPYLEMLRLPASAHWLFTQSAISESPGKVKSIPDLLPTYDDNIASAACKSGEKRWRTLLVADSAPNRKNARGAGRKCSYFTQLLKLFTPTQKRGAWRKDGLRTKLLRSFKAYIRDICKLDDGTRTSDDLVTESQADYCKIRQKLHHVDSRQVLDLRKRIVELYTREKEMFYQISHTGPKNDDKRNGLNHKLSRCNSYNNQYCEQYFEHEHVVEAFNLYVGLIFLGSSLESLCKRFKGTCCALDEPHTSECQDKWECLMEAVLSTEFLRKSVG